MQGCCVDRNGFRSPPPQHHRCFPSTPPRPRCPPLPPSLPPYPFPRTALRTPPPPPAPPPTFTRAASPCQPLSTPWPMPCIRSEGGGGGGKEGGRQGGNGWGERWREREGEREEGRGRLLPHPAGQPPPGATQTKPRTQHPLSRAFQVFCYTGDKAHEEMTQACFDYLALGASVVQQAHSWAWPSSSHPSPPQTRRLAHSIPRLPT